MSLHNSLKIGERFKGRRNVLKRSERIQSLIKDQQWKEGDSLYGLPKTKIVVVKKKKKQKESAEGTATGNEAKPETPAAGSSA